MTWWRVCENSRYDELSSTHYRYRYARVCYKVCNQCYMICRICTGTTAQVNSKQLYQIPRPQSCWFTVQFLHHLLITQERVEDHSGDVKSGPGLVIHDEARFAGANLWKHKTSFKLDYFPVRLISLYRRKRGRMLNIFIQAVKQHVNVHRLAQA